MGQVQAGVAVAALLQIDQHGLAIRADEEVAGMGIEGHQRDRRPLGAGHQGMECRQLGPDGLQGGRRQGRVGQVQGLPIEAPVVLMRVVRFEASGVALAFQN